MSIPYFEVVDPPPFVLVPLFGVLFLEVFLWLLLVVLFELEVAEPLAGGFFAGVVCAKATVEAAAKAMAIKLFFIFFLFSPAGLSSARLTFPECPEAAFSSIACAGYAAPRIGVQMD